MSLHFEPILSGVSYSIKPKSQTPHLKFHHYWLEYGWEYRCAYKSTDWSNNRCWRTIHWGRSPLLCATEIAGSCLVYLFAQKLNWMDTKFNINSWTQLKQCLHLQSLRPCIRAQKNVKKHSFGWPSRQPLAWSNPSRLTWYILQLKCINIAKGTTNPGVDCFDQ